MQRCLALPRSEARNANRERGNLVQMLRFASVRPKFSILWAGAAARPVPALNAEAICDVDQGTERRAEAEGQPTTGAEVGNADGLGRSPEHCRPDDRVDPSGSGG